MKKDIKTIGPEIRWSFKGQIQMAGFVFSGIALKAGTNGEEEEVIQTKYYIKNNVAFNLAIKPFWYQYYT